MEEIHIFFEDDQPWKALSKCCHTKIKKSLCWISPNKTIQFWGQRTFLNSRKRSSQENNEKINNSRKLLQLYWEHMIKGHIDVIIISGMRIPKLQPIDWREQAVPSYTFLRNWPGSSTTLFSPRMTFLSTHSLFLTFTCLSVWLKAR